MQAGMLLTNIIDKGAWKFGPKALPDSQTFATNSGQSQGSLFRGSDERTKRGSYHHRNMEPLRAKSVTANQQVCQKAPLVPQEDNLAFQ